MLNRPTGFGLHVGQPMGIYQVGSMGGEFNFGINSRAEVVEGSNLMNMRQQAWEGLELSIGSGPFNLALFIYGN